MYAPPEPVLSHMWSRGSRPHNFFEEVPRDPVARRRSQQHVRRLAEGRTADGGDSESDAPPNEGDEGGLCATGALGGSAAARSGPSDRRLMYALGTDRTLEEFYEFCGVDFRRR